ncbi:MAG TPA: hypothetical protein VGZ22_15105 [Isosphaeraceae bacterium]|jgi:hypothetical protein|nr:hypothetical protein [Isosphaeraceae bacterium]
MPRDYEYGVLPGGLLLAPARAGRPSETAVIQASLDPFQRTDLMWDRLVRLAILDEPGTIAPALDDRFAPPLSARHPGDEEEEFEEEIEDDEEDEDDEFDDDLDDEDDELDDDLDEDELDEDEDLSEIDDLDLDEDEEDLEEDDEELDDIDDEEEEEEDLEDI